MIDARPKIVIARGFDLATPARVGRHSVRHGQCVRVAAAFLLAAVISASAGCGGGKAAPSGGGNLAMLNSLLINFANTHPGQLPKDEAELRAFIATKGDAWLMKAGVADAASLLTSSRDGQPFEIVYSGTDPRSVRGVIAYEQTGVDGKRHVGFRDGAVREVDEQEFARLTRGS